MKRTILLPIFLVAFFAGNMPAPMCGQCTHPGTMPSIHTYGKPGPTVFQVIKDLLWVLF